MSNHTDQEHQEHHEHHAHFHPPFGGGPGFGRGGGLWGAHRGPFGRGCAPRWGGPGPGGDSPRGPGAGWGFHGGPGGPHPGFRGRGPGFGGGFRGRGPGADLLAARIAHLEHVQQRLESHLAAVQGALAQLRAHQAAPVTPAADAPTLHF